MGNHNEDINRNFGTLFLIILFSLFILISLGKSETQNTALTGSPYQAELVFVNISVHPDAIVFNAVSIPDLYKECLNDLYYTGLNLFSLHYTLSHYNHKTAQHFITMQKRRLVIEPLSLWRLYHPTPKGKKEDSPVLS